MKTLTKMRAPRIEKNVPIPETRGYKPSLFTTTLSKMNVGDSFFTEVHAETVRKAIHRWIFWHKKREKFTVRKYDDGSRVWRIK